MKLFFFLNLTALFKSKAYYSVIGFIFFKDDDFTDSECLDIILPDFQAGQIQEAVNFLYGR